MWFRKARPKNPNWMDSPVPGDDEISKEFAILDSMETFKSAILAVANNNEEEAERTLKAYVQKFDKSDEDGDQALARTGLAMDARLLRVIMGDPNPNGPPSGIIQAEAVAIDQRSGDVVKLPDEEFAMAALTLAANWKWSELDKHMDNRLKQAHREHDDMFMKRFVTVLVKIFVALDGPKRVGWIEDD